MSAAVDNTHSHTRINKYYKDEAGSSVLSYNIGSRRSRVQILAPLSFSRLLCGITYDNEIIFGKRIDVPRYTGVSKFLWYLIHKKIYQEPRREKAFL